MKTNYTPLDPTPEEYEWKTEAVELQICANNDREIYKKFLEPIEHNFMRKVKKGTFDPEKAVKAYELALRTAAKKYAKYNAEEKEWSQIFPAVARRYTAKILINVFIENIPFELEENK